MRFSFGRPLAVAEVRGEDPSGPAGTVAFYPRDGGALVVVDVCRLPAGGSLCAGGIFGFHIHEGDSCIGAGFPETKGHLNPEECPHPYHAGDLPPLFACGDRAFMAVLTDRFRIPDIIGRTVVIHSWPDDFTTQPSGDSGAKIACGVIRPTRCGRC